MPASRALYVEVASLIDKDREHYHKEALKGSVAGVGAEAGIYSVALGLADIFAADNPRFDRGRFLKACGFIP